MPRFGDEARGFLVDDRSAAGSSLLALGAISLAGFGQVVDSVQIHAQLLANRRVEIARHRQVQNKQRPLMPAAGDVLPIVVERDDGPIGAGGADDHVGRRRARRPARPRWPACRATRSASSCARSKSRLRTTSRRAPASARYCSVSWAILPAPITSTRLSSNRSKMRRGEIGDRHAGNAHAVAMERRFAGDAAGDAERGLEQVVHHRAGAADLGRPARRPVSPGRESGLRRRPCCRGWRRRENRCRTTSAPSSVTSSPRTSSTGTLWKSARCVSAASTLESRTRRRWRRRRARRDGRWRGARPRVWAWSRARRPGRRRFASGVKASRSRTARLECLWLQPTIASLTERSMGRLRTCGRMSDAERRGVANRGRCRAA